jgi:ectoine hydroxylase-related dioxygenase (phytanoyl-CoA dioxygenase family)
MRVLPGTHRASVPLHAALPEAHARDARELDPDHVAMREHPDQRTVEVRAGDAVVTDYRLLHGTSANSSHERRDCLLLTFTPSWKDLPSDIRAHLVRNPALPRHEERPPRAEWQATLLPRFAGAPRDLPLNRIAPSEFGVLD